MLRLPPSFTFTVKPEHVNREHRCSSTKCIMAVATMAALPEGFTHYEPSVSPDSMGFFTRDEDDPTVMVTATPNFTVDRSFIRVVRLFDYSNGKDSYAQLMNLIDQGLTFIVDTENLTVRKQED